MFVKSYTFVHSFNTFKFFYFRQKCFCHLDNLQEQANFLKAELQMLNSPIVFCHNDLLLKNILYDESQNKVTFIDFEYSDYNYQAFDIANHFCEFCGVDNFEPSLYPSKDFQLRWLRIYLQKWNSHNDITPTAAELEQSVESLYDVVSRFALASHLYWGLWAVVQANNSSIDFNYLGFAHKRLEEYFKRKHELFGKNNHHKHWLTAGAQLPNTCLSFELLDIFHLLCRHSIIDKDRYFYPLQSNIICNQCYFFVITHFESFNNLTALSDV